MRFFCGFVSFVFILSSICSTICSDRLSYAQFRCYAKLSNDVDDVGDDDGGDDDVDDGDCDDGEVVDDVRHNAWRIRCG